MGRGLSPLQRSILELTATRGIVYYCDVLQDALGWTPEHRIRRYGIPYEAHGKTYTEAPRQPADIGVTVSPGSHYFSPERIGRKRYRSTMVTLSRACTRLEARGLVRVFVGA